MNIAKKLVLAALLLTSCTKVPTINLTEHRFNQSPERMVVVQIPGLKEESFSFLKYRGPEATKKVATEFFACFGKMWKFNHFEMEPRIEDSLVSQISGYPRSEKSCEKYQDPRVWDVLNDIGFSTALYHRGNDKFLDEALSCNPRLFYKTRLFVSRDAKAFEGESFHFEKSRSYLTGLKYKDESCSNGKCFSTVKDNFDHIWKSMSQTSKKLVVIRDFDLLKPGVEKTQYIENLNRFLFYLVHDFSIANPQTTIVVSGVPTSADLSPVWANGPLAENFCGQFNEYDMFKRFFWKSQKTSIPLVEGL
ncbi:hypothetical protein [Bacteriovorax sp. Seq25_V]|uniref:hypothetical protein n=1 Tax=Bacteriovorax sp. Seq25_V TaxID=1201288 RepID=UPI000389F8C8|nr:hypothetical protein [Bacteriovorax sp. Seq25_V]EQC44803.1 hypothetical protein M900_0326 [Bacteriovorax sp. Seq25_V]